ncbi:MAG: ATP/GTP-binding protein [Methanomassiliicoccales archaeon]
MNKIVLAGTAGAGKSTLTAALADWMTDNGYDASVMNLDPGVDELAYDADIDIRDWVKLEEVMKEYGLGPNGAQIVASDLVALNMNKVLEPMEKLETDFLIVDTPGQMELFAYRQSGRMVVEKLGVDESVLAFVSDPAICKTPSGFLSSALLFASVNFRLPIPALNVLSKTDVVEATELERMMLWSRDDEALYSDLLDQDAKGSKPFNVELFHSLRQLGAYTELLPVSAKEYTGLEELYSRVQGIFLGGEDLERR